MNNETTFKPSNSKAVYRPNSKFPIRFEKLLPGSLFRIVAEPSRGKYRVNDDRLYSKSNQGYYATPVDDHDIGVILYPEDLVMPVALKHTGRK